MKAIIPVAGFGTRLRPHTEIRQKCLLPVAGKPVLDHIIEPLISQGFDEIVLITGHLEDQIKKYVRRFDAEFTFARQDEQRGLGHAIFQGLEPSDDPVLIQLGDVIYNLDLTEFCQSSTHKIAVDEVPDPERFGVVEIDKERITRVVEKPKNPHSNLAIVGLYFMTNQKVLYDAILQLMENEITTNSEIQLADAFEWMIGKGEVFQHTKVSKWFDCGIPETFLSTNKALLKPSGLQLDGVVINEPVSIGTDCRIESSVIGPNVTIMDGVTILNSQVEDSIVLWNAKVENEDVEHEIFFKDSSG